MIFKHYNFLIQITFKFLNLNKEAPLHKAAKNGNVKIVQALLKSKKIDINVKDEIFILLFFFL